MLIVYIWPEKGVYKEYARHSPKSMATVYLAINGNPDIYQGLWKVTAEIYFGKHNDSLLAITTLTNQ